MNFLKMLNVKLKNLIELFENVNDGSIKKELDAINEKSKNKLDNLLELVNEKYNYFLMIFE